MGWSEGKGLGLNENGIVKAIKPNVQLNSRGLGFSVSDSLQIKNQWWSDAYNSASKGMKHDYRITSVGVVVKSKSKKNSQSNEKNDNDKYGSRFKSAGYLERHEDKIISENSSAKKKKKEKSDDFHDDIPKTTIEVLDVEYIIDDENLSQECKKNKKNKRSQEGINDSEVIQLDSNNEDNGEEDLKIKSPNKKTKKTNHIDFNEIFQMSKGMTCHKAARHGINMTGKMKRLQEQEAEFLRKYKA